MLLRNLPAPINDTGSIQKVFLDDESLSLDPGIVVVLLSCSQINFFWRMLAPEGCIRFLWVP